MVDIDVYEDYENYMKFQHLRPDYVNAIQKTLELAKKHTSNMSEITIADFCCGTGSNSKAFANSMKNVKKVSLIDINKGFLEIAKKSNINSEKIEFHNEDILKVKLKREFNVVFSIFAYHHVKDEEKKKYIEQVKSCLKKEGILVLTEIFIKDKKQAIEYYDKLFNEIPNNKVISGLKEFLGQTAKSNDFEFKVTKDFSDNQFKNNGFTLLEEVKIHPKDSSFKEDIGTFVQIYQL